MNKPKRRVMCPDCGKQKMLFKTEQKAQNFIKFNNDEFQHDGELRVYFCPACGGYHITHQELHEDMLKQTDKLIEEYEKQKETLTESDYELIDELYHILLALNLKDKRKVNAFLNQPIYKTKYGKFICQEAKVKYFFRDSNN